MAFVCSCKENPYKPVRALLTRDKGGANYSHLAQLIDKGAIVDLISLLDGLIGLVLHALLCDIYRSLSLISACWMDSASKGFVAE